MEATVFERKMTSEDEDQIISRLTRKGQSKVCIRTLTSDQDEIVKKLLSQKKIVVVEIKRLGKHKL